jgi:transglutaminase-like putative cysteine protease
MQFNTQEIAGSRVRLRYAVELYYTVNGFSEFLISVHAARTPRQKVIEESFVIDPPRTVLLSEDPTTGNRIASFNASSGQIRIAYEGVVEIRHRFVEPDAIVAESPGMLPVSTLQYLYSSRYCQVDQVQQQAWDRFGTMPRGYAQVQAVHDWVRETLKFQVGSSCVGTSVVETLRDGRGVCRDFAHTMITFCRALNYPARFVTGVDYGADVSYGPPDFHAYVEVFIGGAWYLFDPTGISMETGLARIGTGRDAAEASFATIFGPVQTGMPKVEYSATDDPIHGYVLPARTTLAMSTAD